MLDEPPLIVRMRGLAGSIANSLVMLQAERGQLCARGLEIRVTDAAYSQTVRDLDEQWLVIDIDDLLGWYLGDVQCKPKDVRVGFAEVDKAGGDKEIYEPI
jgi:diadenosine tetraphosphatase ApaH/serine/threonine PP2A family protein phosphatase